MYIDSCDVIEEEGVLIITGNCVFTGLPYTVQAKKEDILKWMNGALIQDALDYLSEDDREFLISGISPTGWMLQYGQN